MSRRRIELEEQSAESKEEYQTRTNLPIDEKFVECLKGHNMLLSEGKCKKCGSPAKPMLETE